MNETPEIYEKVIMVSSGDLDSRQHVNNVQYVQWIQDIAEEHWEKRAPEETKNAFYWVVVRHEVDYKKQAFLDEELILQTFVGDQTHVTSVRIVNIIKKETGDILCSAKTTWVLLDMKTKKPAKISDELIRVFFK